MEYESIAEYDYRKARELRGTSGERETEAPQKGGDYLVKIVLCQSAVCLFAVLLLLTVMKAAPSAFEQIKTAYSSVMGGGVSAGEAVSVMKNYFVSGMFATATDSNDGTATRTDTTELSVGGKDFEVVGEEIDVLLADVFSSMTFSVPREGRITSEFGLREHPITGKRSFHTGLDIGADEGERIAAAFDGIVSATGFSEGLGFYVAMKHENGVGTLYCHCSEILAEMGAVLRAGETVALVGTTGYSTGPHLHFEITVDGAYCDPAVIMNYYVI